MDFNIESGSFYVPSMWPPVKGHTEITEILEQREQRESSVSLCRVVKELTKGKSQKFLLSTEHTEEHGFFLVA